MIGSISCDYYLAGTIVGVAGEQKGSQSMILRALANICRLEGCMSELKGGEDWVLPGPRRSQPALWFEPILGG